ncbi:MAG TPA: response regulator [Bryobacteraceae bacterium]|nr:response regulator [Bryobacteraceae bacterium]
MRREGTQGGMMLPSRVVLVEDNEADVYLVSMALREAGFPGEPSVFRDGEDAVASFRKAAASACDIPDLILLDLNLPRIDGKFIVEMLRGNRAFDHVPVMLLSSTISPADAAKTQEFRSCMYTTKPSTLDAFMALGRAAKDFWINNHQAAATV